MLGKSECGLYEDIWEKQREQLLQQVTTRGTLIIIYRNGGVNGTNDTNHVGNKCREHVGSESY